MAPRVRLIPACLAASAVAGAIHLLRQPAGSNDAFVTPSNLRGEAAAALAAAVVAGSLGAPGPASAAATKFSFFGFGDGTSDAYAQNDKDQKNPYSQFSNPKDRMFKEDAEVYMQKKKVALDESFKRLLRAPQLIKTKQSENLKSLLTLQLEMMRQNMEYITAKGAPGYRNNDESTPAFQKANAFFQDISDLNVYGKSKKWPEAAESYSKAMVKLDEWKKLVAY